MRICRFKEFKTMNIELEKILEEIDEEILLKKVVWNSIEKPPYGREIGKWVKKVLFTWGY